MGTDSIDRSSVHKILVIKPRAIGDVLLSTSVLKNIRAEFPGARISFMVERFAADVLKDNPHVDGIIAYDPRKDSSLSVIMNIRKNKFDLVFDLFSNPRTAIVTWLSGAQYRVGYPFKWRRHAYNIQVPPRGAKVHNVEFNLDALRRIGLQPRYKSPEFYLDETSRAFALSFLKSRSLVDRSFIAVNIGGGWETKRWRMNKIVELCRLIESRLAMPVVVTYGPKEKEDASRVSGETNAILAPETSLHQMGAIFERSLLVVTNDSGPMHIAAALGVPTLALFGPTSPSLQGPYGNLHEIVRCEGLSCLECNLTKCSIGTVCMEQLEPEYVFERLQGFITKIKAGADKIHEGV